MIVLELNFKQNIDGVLEGMACETVDITTVWMKTGRQRCREGSCMDLYEESGCAHKKGSPRRSDSKVISYGSQWDSSVNLGRKRTHHSIEATFISYCRLCEDGRGAGT